MKKYMILVCMMLCLLSIGLRLVQLPEIKSEVKITTYDALGYYIYLPSIFIYDDVKTYKWLDSLDRKNNFIGGWNYQLGEAPNGNNVVKYFGGVAMMQLPFFLVANEYAKKSTTYKADGFSSPYQYAVLISSIFYFCVGVFLLGFFLLKHFSTTVSVISIAATIGATNILQYVSVDSGMVHSYLFFWYSFVVFITDSWIKDPKKYKAWLIGIGVGWATFCRPTEAILFLIPLFWIKEGKTIASNWKLYKPDLFFATCGAFLIFLPQLIYWKIVTGHFIYDVGSKWTFLNPWFRVLFGEEKGWFVYTPITILFIIGLWFMSRRPFSKSIIWFTILNIWIVISWYDWQYGASYSARALSHSLPLLALPLACLLTYLRDYRMAWLSILATIPILIGINLFQIWQYNAGILHYSKMNRLYHSKIFLNADPNPLEISTLDNPFWIDTTSYEKVQIFDLQDVVLNSSHYLTIPNESRAKYFMISFNANNPSCYWDGGYQTWQTEEGKDKLISEFPAHNPISVEDGINEYSYFIINERGLQLKVGFKCPYNSEVKLSKIKVSIWE